jgi:hypothetical protein
MAEKLGVYLKQRREQKYLTDRGRHSWYKREWFKKYIISQWFVVLIAEYVIGSPIEQKAIPRSGKTCGIQIRRPFY